MKTALGYLEAEKDRKAIAAALVILAGIGYAIDQTEYANRCYHSALAIYQEIGYYEGRLDTYTRQFNHTREHGDVDGALAALRAAVDLAKAHDRPHDETRLLRHLADLLSECGSSHEAAEALKRAQQLLECAPRLQPEDLGEPGADNNAPSAHGATEAAPAQLAQRKN